MCTRSNLNVEDVFVSPSRLVSISKPTDKICIKFGFWAHSMRVFNLVYFMACGHIQPKKIKANPPQSYSTL